MGSEVAGFVMWAIITFLWVMFVRVKPHIKWLLWKKKAKLAIGNGQVTKCSWCRDYIFPGQDVIKIKDENKYPGEFLVHASDWNGHFSLKYRIKTCAIVKGIQPNFGMWDGYKFVPSPDHPQIS